MTVFYTCVYSLVTETAQQHELLSTNLKILLLYPKGFCYGGNKFLITTEASPCHYFCSCCLFLFIGTHQHNVPLPTAAGFVRYLRMFFLLAYISFIAFYILFFHLQVAWHSITDILS